MAGMATIAPTGTAASPAPRTARGHGTPSPWARWLKAAAPMAAKAAWQSETWPDDRTSSRSERNTSTKIRALV